MPGGAKGKQIPEAGPLSSGVRGRSRVGVGMGVTSWPRASALSAAAPRCAPGPSSAMRRGEAPGIAVQAGCAREIAEIGPESGCDRVSLCQAERWRDCEIPDTGEVRHSREARGRPRRGPGVTRTRAQTPRCGPRGRPAAWPAPGLITRNRSAGTRRQAASERPRPCPLAGGPQQRPRRAAGSWPVASSPRSAARPFPSLPSTGNWRVYQRGGPKCLPGHPRK